MPLFLGKIAIVLSGKKRSKNMIFSDEVKAKLSGVSSATIQSATPPVQFVHIEQVVVFLIALLYDSYSAVETVEGITTDGTGDAIDEKQLAVQHFPFQVQNVAGTVKEQQVIRMSCQINKQYKYSSAPWQHVQALGAVGDQPNAVIVNQAG